MRTRSLGHGQHQLDRQAQRVAVEAERRVHVTHHDRDVVDPAQALEPSAPPRCHAALLRDIEHAFGSVRP